MRLKLGYAALLFLGLAVVAGALPKWSELRVQTGSDQAVEIRAEGFAFFMGGKLAGPATFDTSFDPQSRQWTFLFDSEFFANRTVTGPEGNLIAGSSQIKTKAFADKLDTDTRDVRVQGKRAYFGFWRNGKQVRSANQELGVDVLDVDAMSVLLRELLRTAPTSFNADIIFKARGWRVNVDYEYLTIDLAGILKLNKAFPAGYLEILKTHASFNCFRMHATGFLGLIDGSQFYYLFANDESRRFLGYFGASGDMAEGLILNPQT